MNFVGSCTVLYGEEEAKVEEGDVMIILIGADDLEYFFLAHANICSFLLHLHTSNLHLMQSWCVSGTNIYMRQNRCCCCCCCCWIVGRIRRVADRGQDSLFAWVITEYLANFTLMTMMMMMMMKWKNASLLLFLALSNRESLAWMLPSHDKQTNNQWSSKWMKFLLHYDEWMV